MHNPYDGINNVVYLLCKVESGNAMPLGTCFLTSKPGVFVTCAHVTRGVNSNLMVAIQEPLENGYQDTSPDRQVKFFPVQISEHDPVTDLSLLTSGLDVTSNVKIMATDDINVGEAVTIFGFPHANTGRTVLTQQRTEIGAKILLDSSGVKTKHMVLNVQARPGQSGGPIFRNSDLSLVGILIGAYAPTSQGGISLGGVDPQTLHQTTHAVSAEYLRDML